MEENFSSLLWFRRDLRLYDNRALKLALQKPGKIMPIFIFDQNILKSFPNKKDRRVSFIAKTLLLLDRQLRKKGGRINIFFGTPEQIIPKLVRKYHIKHVIAGKDHEASNIARDEEISKLISPMRAKLELILDHLILEPDEVLKGDGSFYKVFTPYSKAFKAKLNKYHLEEAIIQNDEGRYCNIIDSDAIDIRENLDSIGYEYVQDEYWQPEKALKSMYDFIDNRCKNYKEQRDFLAINGTSKLSPYLRFGLISVRHLYRLCLELSESYINELIWREFYAMIFYHMPETENQEFQEQYRNLNWQYNEKLFEKYIKGETGYPVIDAAMKQLMQEGWMHNRARMIVASFLTKDLLMDWRLGERHFGQYLMDYEKSSNVGGWQWASSTGTDAQPYFRIFNPLLQSKKFDPDGKYIKKYLPELKMLTNPHEPKEYYIRPIIDRKNVSERVNKLFKK